MRRKVFISGPAQKDVRQIVNLIRLDKPLAAKQFKMFLMEKARSLEFFAQRGRKIPELQKTPFKNHRELLVNNYRLIYKLAKNEVHILRIIHAKKNLSFF